MKSEKILETGGGGENNLSISTWYIEGSCSGEDWYSCLGGKHKYDSFEDTNQGPFDSEEEAFEYQLEMLIKMVVMVKKAMVMERGK